MAISKLQELAGIGSNSNYVLKESIHYDENTDIIYYTDLMGGFRGIDVSDSNKEDYFLAGNRNLGSETALNETNDILEMALNLRSGILTSDMERGVIIYGWSLNINHETGLFDFYSEICLDVEEYGMDMSVIQGNVQSLKTILNNQDFVGIACHGGNYSLYGQENTILEMPELTNTAADKAYAKDINNQNVIKITSSNDFDTEMQEKYYITGSFFETYYGNNGYGSDILNDTIIYIGSCHGLGDDGNVRRNLANSFLFSGAECVLGHVNSVNVTYDANIMNEVIFNLIDGNDVQEALYQAELKYGEDDVEYWERYTGKTIDKIPAYNEIVFLEQETFPYWEEYKKTSISGKITSGWNEDNVLFLENVNITLEKDGNIYRTIVTDESGNYSFLAVAPGSYTIKYEKQDYETLTKEINVNFSNNVKEDINMIFTGETGLSGHVVDSDKNFLSDVSIEISDSLNEEIVANISTDENGEFFINIQNGIYTIRFIKEGYDVVICNNVRVNNDILSLDEIVMKIESEDCDSSQIIATGKCGPNLTWKLDSNDVLTISGTGNMYNFVLGSLGTCSASWFNYRNDFTKVIVEDGVTSIGDYAFYRCFDFTEISIPSSVNKIGQGAFRLSIGLESIIIPDNVTEINAQVFNDCSSLEYIIMPYNLERIDKSAFGNFEFESEFPNSNLANLKAIYFNGDATAFLSIDEDIFKGGSFTVYYPAGNETWTYDIRQNYGGNITWVEWDPELLK